VSISRMSFQETPNILNSLGFLNRISAIYRIADETIIIQKGSLVFGFRSGNGSPYGFLYDNDIELEAPAHTGNYYITVDIQGAFGIELGNFNNIHGLGANIAGIPWYTYNNKALVAKVFLEYGISKGIVICDDAFWCEFEGSF